MELKKNNIHGSMLCRYETYYYEYFTIDILEPGTFTMCLGYYTPYYMKNGGDWIPGNFDEDGWWSIDVIAGDQIRIKCDLDDDGWLQINPSSPSFNVSGNIMSLIYSEGFPYKTELTPGMAEYSPFSEMFKTCKVKDASKLYLPCTTSCKYLYHKMFTESTIVKAPQLMPAHLSLYSYAYMFCNCSHLTGQIVVPEPLGIIQANHSYERMFQINETKYDHPSDLEVIMMGTMQAGLDELNLLSFGPKKCKFVLPWEGQKYTYTNENGYQGSLSFEPDYFKEESREQYLYKQLYPAFKSSFTLSPDSFGTVLKEIGNPCMYPDAKLDFTHFITNSPIKYDEETETYSSGIEFIDPMQIYKSIPLTFETLDVCEFAWTHGYKNVMRNFSDILEYSINGGDWLPYQQGIVVPANTKVSWRAKRDLTSEDESDTYSVRIVTNGLHVDGLQNPLARFNAYGNIMSLLSPNFETMDEIPWEECFKSCFADTQIQNARNMVLPATKLKDGCYESMFIDSDLYIAPGVLPVKHIRHDRIYKNMFKGCKRLQKPPILMAASIFSEGKDYETLNETLWVMDVPTAPAGEKLFRSTELFTSGPSEAFMQMFKECETLSIAPEIRICYLDTEYPPRGIFEYMFEQCPNLNYVKMTTHSWSPGYINNLGSAVRGIVDYDKPLYVYDKFNDSYDLAISYAQSFYYPQASIQNLHLNLTPPEIPADDDMCFYIVKLKENTTGQEGTPTRYVKKHPDYTWSDFYYDVLSNQGVTLNGTSYLVRPYKGLNYVVAGYMVRHAYADSDYPTSHGHITASTHPRDAILPHQIIAAQHTYYVNEIKDRYIPTM